MGITRQRTRVLIAALAAALALAGCGDDGGGPSSGGTATLKVGVIPIADVAPLYVGIDQGFFKAEKLKIEPAMMAGVSSGSTIVRIVCHVDAPRSPEASSSESGTRSRPAKIGRMTYGSQMYACVMTTAVSP